jgi:hypothetical protein
MDFVPVMYNTPSHSHFRLPLLLHRKPIVPPLLSGRRPSTRVASSHVRVFETNCWTSYRRPRKHDSLQNAEKTHLLSIGVWLCSQIARSFEVVSCERRLPQSSCRSCLPAKSLAVGDEAAVFVAWTEKIDSSSIVAGNLYDLLCDAISRCSASLAFQLSYISRTNKSAHGLKSVIIGLTRNTIRA